jgi:putative hydrolase of the HAD superfamily
MTAPRIQAVLFDMDDTIFDHQYSSECGLAELHQQHICFQQATLAQLVQAHRVHLEELHNEVLAGQRTLDSARLERFRRLFAGYQTTLAEAQAAAVATSYRGVFQANRRLIPGVRALLEFLHGQVRIGVVTNNMVAEQEEKIAHLGIGGLIDALVVSEAVGVPKPAPEIFAAALARLGCDAAAAVMVGDSWENDIVGASRAGIRSIWLNRFGLDCPDPVLATQITAYEPLEQIVSLIVNGD